VTVHLVGAGPGDPGLLTVRGADVLGRAEVVVYDRLSVASLLDLAPPGAERISVGKAPGRVTLPQDEINALLVRLGSEGKRVVRLKGGDPFVFARGGEEAAALAAAHVPYEVVPGITSALAVPAYAGIPVTLRHSSTSFTVVTGHEDPSKHDDADGVANGDRSVDWDAVARVGGTIVILMGVARWPAIARKLVEGGLDPATPAAAVQWGTRPEQRTTRATLATLGDHELASPSVIVVGAVASEQLGWFEDRPLFGRRIVVTRARDRAGRFAALLREQGAEVVEAPAIETADPTDAGAALRRAASELTAGRYDWVVCTSATGVERLFAVLRDARDLGGVKVAVVGPGTARALAARGVVADLVPKVAVGDDLAAAFPVGAGRVLQIRPEIARDVVARELRSKGWDVDEVVAYRTVSATLDEATRARVQDADAVTFTSSSTVDNLVDLVGIDGLPAVTVSIGPITSLSLEAHGIEPTVEAAPHTIDGLLDAVVSRFVRR
jgi:uroporphyrinogen III methyltransferase/synthase